MALPTIKFEEEKSVWEPARDGGNVVFCFAMSYFARTSICGNKKSKIGADDFNLDFCLLL